MKVAFFCFFFFVLPLFRLRFSTGRSSVVVFWSCKRHKYLQLGWRTGPILPSPHTTNSYWESLLHPFCLSSFPIFRAYSTSFFFCSFFLEMVRVGCVAPPTSPSYSTRRRRLLFLWSLSVDCYKKPPKEEEGEEDLRFTAPPRRQNHPPAIYV
jgi:hypothetical protein